MLNILGYISSIIIDNNIYLLITEVFGLGIGSGSSEGVKEFELKIRLSQSNLAEAGTELGNKRRFKLFPQY